MLFERSSFADLCKARLAQLREAWTDVARTASIQSRQGGNPSRPGSRKRERDKRSAEPQKADAAKQRAEGPQQVVKGAEGQQQAAKGTAAIQKQLQDRESRSKAAQAGQRAEFGADAAKKQAAAAAEAKAKAAADKKGKGGGGGAAEKKAIAAEHDAKIKPIASELSALAAQGKRATPEYAQKYAAYQAANDAKRAALGGQTSTTAPPKPENEKKGSRTAARKAQALKFDRGRA